MANWIKLRGTAGHVSSPLYAINMDYAVSVKFSDFQGQGVYIEIAQGGDGGKHRGITLSNEDAELISA